MSKKSRTHVGILGLGIIGTRIAAVLRKAGWPVFVWNRSPKAEPNFLGSPGEIAEHCDIIQIFVADATALFQVIGAMATKLGPQHVVLCNATVGPEATRLAAKMVTDLGAAFLDAPFTGSKAAAEKGGLVYYIGGAPEAFARVEDVLKASSKSIVKVGEVGQAATMKLVLNEMVANSVQSLAEGVALLRGDGIDAALLQDALADHGLRSGLLEMKLPHMLDGNYEPHFSVKNMLKDLRLGLSLAGALGVAQPLAEVSAQLLADCTARGWGDLDFAALSKRLERPERPKALPAPARVEETEAAAPEQGEVAKQVE